ncbi:MAG: hypothetical protein Q8M67_00800, partial [Bacteroidota bacterium]|nr:hypothetical protein [Bacteroidota bacterium]
MTTIPEIEYSLLEEEMTAKQLEFFKEVEAALNKDNFIDVGINDWYVELYIQKYIHNITESTDIENIRNKMLCIDRLYSGEEYLISAKQFANECLIALKRFDEFLKDSQDNDVLADFT